MSQQEYVCWSETDLPPTLDETTNAWLAPPATIWLLQAVLRSESSSFENTEANSPASVMPSLCVSRCGLFLSCFMPVGQKKRARSKRKPIGVIFAVVIVRGS